MESSARLDIFEPGDRTALVCVNVPALQNLVVEQLTDLAYKIHTGLSVEDLVLKIRAHIYDVILISEHFGATECATNSVLAEAVNASPDRRHKQFLVLMGATFTSDDDLQAFSHSVDLVIGLADVVHLRLLLPRGLARAEEFYAPFREVLRVARAM